MARTSLQCRECKKDYDTAFKYICDDCFGPLDVKYDFPTITKNTFTNREHTYWRYFELLPIENESRKIPQSGYYKKEPFHGSWQERTDARNQFNDYIEKQYGIKRWTKHLYNQEGELDFKYMEKPQSIQLNLDPSVL